MKEKKNTCVKCGKEKKESKGTYSTDKGDFCCEDCCGKAEQDEEKSDVCEFC